MVVLSIGGGVAPTLRRTRPPDLVAAARSPSSPPAISSPTSVGGGRRAAGLRSPHAQARTRRADRARGRRGCAPDRARRRRGAGAADDSVVRVPGDRGDRADAARAPPL